MKEHYFTNHEVRFLCKYYIDEVNQRIDIKGIFLPKDDRNLIRSISVSVIQSVRANLESLHLTHVA